MSLLDKPDVIIKTYEDEFIAGQLHNVKEWLSQNVTWGVYDSAYSNFDHRDPFFEIRSFNKSYPIFRYSHIEIVIKENNFVYIRPLSPYPIRIVGYFNGTIPDYIRFDSPWGLVKLHIEKDVRPNWEEDVEGNGWIASSYYSGEFRYLCNPVNPQDIQTV